MPSPALLAMVPLLVMPPLKVPPSKGASVTPSPPGTRTE
jgi:hypothetical protein